jgi:aspartyl/asparaginyl-tRNA synthetase
LAGNRCPNCNKFVSIDYEVETDDPEINEQSDILEITTTFTIKKVCAECGEELATKEIESIEHTDKSDFEEV